MKKFLLASSLVVFFSSFLSAQSMFREVNDFDGDGKADFAVTRDENFLKVWHIWQTTAGYKRVQWGLPTDNNAAGDYDGDGRTDIAVARETPGDNASFTSYILHSQTGTVAIKTVTNPFNFALFSGPQDYDGDGKSDPAISYAEPGSNALFYLSSAIGATGAANMPSQLLARIGDLTGDGRCEAASFLGAPFSETVTFWVRNLATGELRGVPWGLSGDEPLPADFDGDGKGDLTIWRPSSGEWWWIRSSDSVANVAHWGRGGDIPVPADYDGDGKTDHAVFRIGDTNENNIYYIYGSATGPRTFFWGIPGDQVVRY